MTVSTGGFATNLSNKILPLRRIIMTQKLQIYKCEKCGNIVEILHGNGAPVVCCGVNMTLLEEKSADSSTEKHVPIIKKIDGGFKVVVGSTPHPMTDEHYIEWIELIAGDKVYREFLNPGAPAEAVFYIEADNVTARELCNVHGLWKG